MEGLWKVVRGMKAGSNVQFQHGDFILDLSYITERVIAMSFPAEGMEATFRNNIDHVAQALNQNHPNHYRVYNLSERNYNYQKLNNSVRDFGFPDHHPPPLELAFRCCQDMKFFLETHQENVVIVHCLAGKGRTGTIIACFLVYCGLFKSASEALLYFAAKRSDNYAGVSMASQRRYIGYFARIVCERYRPSNTGLMLKALRMNNLSRSDADTSVPQFDLYDATAKPPQIIFSSERCPQISSQQKTSTTAVVNFVIEKPILGDVLFVFRAAGSFGSRKKLFRFSLNVGMLNHMQIRLPRNEIDEIETDSRYEKDFSVDLIFAQPIQNQITTPIPIPWDTLIGAEFQNDGQLVFMEPNKDRKIADARKVSARQEEFLGKGGWLFKQGENVKSWKRRWFVLKPDSVSYFKSAKEATPIATIPLGDVLAVHLIDEPQPSAPPTTNLFEMCTVKRNFLISCENHRDLEEWTEAIEAARTLQRAKRPRAKVLAKLRVKIHEVTNLSWEALSPGANAPYCMITCGKEKRLSQVQRNTLNPIFEESFSMDITSIEDSVYISVLSQNAKVADTFLGELIVPLHSLLNRPTMVLQTPLQKRSMLQYYITGKIHVELQLEMIPVIAPAVSQLRDSTSAAPLSGAHRGSAGAASTSSSPSSGSPAASSANSSGFSSSSSSPLSHSLEGFTLISND